MVVADKTLKRTLRPKWKANSAIIAPLSLENGARLSRPEFERLYETMPHIKKAELIEGVVFMPSPIHHTGHSRPHAQIMAWLGLYWTETPGVDLGDNASVRFDMINELQPDALLRLETVSGGASRISDDDYIEGAPELIVEIAASSVSYDLHTKKDVYLRNGVQEYIVWRVQEYIVWRVYEGMLDWFQLEEGAYRRLEPGEDSVIRSRVFPGLHLAVESLLTGDRPAVLRVVKEGMEREEHAVFVERLAQGA